MSEAQELVSFRGEFSRLMAEFGGKRDGLTLDQWVRAKLAEKDAEIERLQLALFRWLPHIRGTGSEQDEAAANDAFLLVGLGSDCACYGEGILQRAEAAERELAELREIYEGLQHRTADLAGKSFKAEKERDALRAQLEAIYAQPALELVAGVFGHWQGKIVIERPARGEES